MNFLVRAQERFSRGATVGAVERWQGPAEVHDDPSINGIAFGIHEERVSLAPGDKGGRGYVPNIAPSANSVVM